MASCWLPVLTSYVVPLTCEEQMCQAFSLDKKNHLEQRDFIKDFLKTSKKYNFLEKH